VKPFSMQPLPTHLLSCKRKIKKSVRTYPNYEKTTCQHG
jgi:hypothetical protein